MQDFFYSSLKLLRLPHPLGLLLPISGHFACFQAHSCPGLHQFNADDPQLGQRRQRHQLLGVLLQSPVTSLDVTELALDHPKRVLYMGWPSSAKAVRSLRLP